MNKVELFRYVQSIENKNKALVDENAFLLHQQDELKKLAEKSGSEKAVIHSKFILLEEEHRKLQCKLDGLTVIKNERKKSK